VISAVCGLILALAALLPAQGATSSLRSGLATWYDDGPGLYAAAGPDLRHGDWRGSFVTVTSGSRSVTVQLTDWCACGDRNGRPTLLDLSATAFRRLAPLSKGVIAVEVTTGARIELPRTDTR
jgi:rare lipoprotein A (peptidoglycan hydrolase)